MGEAGKIRPDQLRMAKRILSELPVKDNRCSREQAAAFLEKDLKRAFRKGYNPKELCALFKKAGIIIPERLIAPYQEPADETVVNCDSESGKRGSHDQRTSMVPSQKIMNDEVAKDVTPSGEVETADMP